MIDQDAAAHGAPGSRAALVTGAAGALGQALVEKLLQRGFDVIALDRNRRALERMHDRLAESGRTPLIVPLDLAGAGPQHYAELAEALAGQFAGIDLVIHAAAEFSGLAPLQHADPEDWIKSLQAGVTGPFLLSQALLGAMRGRDGAQMLFVIDNPDEKKRAYWGGYGVSQSARVALASILAAECRHDGITVETVDPGPFFSPIRSRAWPAEDPASLPHAGAAAERVLAAVELAGG